jgi:hypothetical protein
MFLLKDHLFRLLDHFCFDSATGSEGRLSQTTEESMRQAWSWLSFTGLPCRMNNFQEACTQKCLAETTPPPPRIHRQDTMQPFPLSESFSLPLYSRRNPALLIVDRKISF